MKCIKCKGKTRVAETLSSQLYVLRKRKCVECGTQFITREQFDSQDGMMHLFNKWRKG